MMASNGPHLLTAHVRRLRAAPLAGLSDGELLRRFIRGGPDAGPAFELVVRRHGPMVLRVCRAAVGDPHAADDCFQAVFLVLVRKARSFRPSEPLGPWLFGIARRVCSNANAAKARRFRHEAAAAKTEIATTSDAPAPDVTAVVHAEVGRLPEALRAAVVLCDLAGLSYEQAAERLGVLPPTLRGRLARGRDRLRRRLELRGIRPDGIWAAAVAVPSALVTATADAAEVVTGRAAGMVSETILELVTEGVHSMMVTKFKAAGLSALTAGVLVAGALGLGAQGPPTQPAPAQPPASGSLEYRGTLSLLTATPDDRDPGDDVAALVRKAQRQQDRGDVEGARKTVKQVEAASKRWSASLTKRAPAVEATPALSFEAAPRPGAAATAPGGYGRPPVGAQNAPAIELVPGGPGATPPGQPGSPYGRGPTATPAQPPTAGLEARLRDLEKELTRLRKEVESQRAHDPKP